MATPDPPLSYAPRPIRCRGVRTLAGYRLKLYTITFDGRPPDRAFYEKATRLAAPQLPRPAKQEGRPGVGFLIWHRGRSGGYVVLAWWDEANELFVRVWLEAPDLPAGWKLATSGTTACVWDLVVFAHERDAFVQTLLLPAQPDPSAYLQRRLRADDYVTIADALAPPLPRKKPKQ